MGYAKEHDTAVQAAREAAAFIRDRAGEVAKGDTRDKGINDFVTAADEEAQRRILRTLQDTFPEYGVLAEEGAGSYESDVDHPRWIVDPIDGTTNFMHGVPPYAVSIALQDEGRIVVGVVLEVSSDELFTAVRGEGLQVNGNLGRVSETSALADSLVTTGFPYRSFDHLEAYMEVLTEFVQNTQGVRRPGSAAVDLAYLASGRFDGFFETGLHPWDVAAGALLVEEAGGRVTDYRSGGDPVFEQQVLATNGRIHSEMQDVLQPMSETRV